MTKYNVVTNRTEWARVKAALLTDEDRAVLMRELIKKDEAGAVVILAELAAIRHGQRMHDRKAQNTEKTVSTS